MISALFLTAETCSTTNLELTNKPKTSLTQLIYMESSFEKLLKEKRKVSRRPDEDEYIDLSHKSSEKNKRSYRDLNSDRWIQSPEC